jgi:hypothetical protein
VYHLDDASRGVNVHPGDSELALDQMVAQGARRITFSDVVSAVKSK